MLKLLELQNCFVHKNLVLNFEKGLTNISGPNGSGKSLIPEMIEFGFWGSQALRGLAPSYKGMKMALEFVLRNRNFRVERTITSADLYEGKVKIASGTKPVNTKIAELFGYSYEVYKVTNVARQGEIERMGAMKPTERKQLVDETIGLARIDLVGEWAAKYATEAGAQVRALTPLIVAPDPLPDPPPEVTQAQVNDLRKMAMTYEVNAHLLTEPKPVASHELYDSLPSLKLRQQERAQTLAQIQGIDVALKGFPTLGDRPSLHPEDANLETLKAQASELLLLRDQRQSLSIALNSCPEASTYSDAELDEAEAQLNMLLRWTKKKELVENLAEFVCPACDHHWHSEDPRLKDYQDVPEKMPEVKMTRNILTRHRQVNAYQETRTSYLKGIAAIDEKLKSLQDNGGLIELILACRRNVERFEQRLVAENQRLDLIVQREKLLLSLPEDQSGLIQDIENVQRVVDQYKRELMQHMAAVMSVRHIPVNIKSLLEEAEKAREAWVQWEYCHKTHEKATLKYQRNLEKLNLIQQEWEDWKNTKEAISLLRARIKGYLLPSLNEVSTRLLNLMSNGWLNWVVVNEDFNIIVDEKPISALSGAGKALTNLALRIGLGQVLTNSVFSVLILDESDAGVDVDKAPMVAKALRALTGTIQQIIVISHKQGLESDHQLRFQL